MTHLTRNTGNTEWYTPSYLVDAVREVLEVIDLDPASSKQAQRTIQAQRYFTVEDDGLCQNWSGRVFLNPPYSRLIIDKFILKLLASDLISWITLTNDCMDTKWAHNLLNKANAVCFIRGRISFIGINGEKGKPLRGQMLCYYGERTSEFARIFSQFGTVIHVVQSAQTSSYTMHNRLL